MIVVAAEAGADLMRQKHRQQRFAAQWPMLVWPLTKGTLILLEAGGALSGIFECYDNI